MKNRIISLDIVRCLCVLYIVSFWHMGDYIKSYYPAIFSDVTTGVLATFTFISGLFLGKKRMPVLTFYKKRLSRFFFLFLISCLSFYAFGSIKTFTQLCFTLTGLSCFIPPQPMTLWYFSMIIIFYMITPWLNFNTNNNKNIFLRAVLSLILLVTLVNITDGDHRVSLMYCFYLLGYFTPVKTFQNTKSLGYLFVLMLAGGFLLLLGYYYEFKFLASLGVCIFVSFLGVLLQECIPDIVKKCCVFLSYSSMSAYLFHRQVYGGVKHIFFSDGSAFPLWLVPILVVCLFGISYAIQVAYDYLINNFILKKK